MTRWEYYCFAMTWILGDGTALERRLNAGHWEATTRDGLELTGWAEILDHLNQMGQEGWELVNCAPGSYVSDTDQTNIGVYGSQADTAGRIVGQTLWFKRAIT